MRFSWLCQNCSAKATVGCIGDFGLVLRDIAVSLRYLSPFLWLHVSQAIATLSQVWVPPLERGMMWSMVSCLELPQYWQRCPSRLSSSRRLTLGIFHSRSAVEIFKRMWCGTSIVTDGDRSSHTSLVSCKSKGSALPLIRRVMARRILIRDIGK